MNVRIPSGRTAVIALMSLACLSISVANGQEDNGYTNLQILDPDITRDDLGMAMLQNTLGLGLPRRQREGCLFCHVGDMDLPVAEWDFAADDKETKLKARVMMAMVKDINTNHLSQLENRLDESTSVSCITCHSGRTDPRPLPDVLRATYSSDGISATIDKYHDLRERYLGAGAYDFRPSVLIRFAYSLTGQGAWDDALAIASVNEAVHREIPIAAQARLTIQIEIQLEEHGVATAVNYFERERGKEAPGVDDHAVLDGIGWWLYRQDRIDEALQFFRKNVDLFSTEYIPNESLGDALWFADDMEGGITIFESWVEKNPDHEQGRRRLLNMQEELN